MSEVAKAPRLSNRFVRYFLEAAQAEMGAYSLKLMLQQAGLQRYEEEFPVDDDWAVTTVKEFAALQAALHEYYGLGARGTLNRVGRNVWRMIATNASLRLKLRLAILHWLPHTPRCRLILETLVKWLGQAGALFSLHLMDQDLIMVDHASPASFVSHVSHEADVVAPACWATLGMIQAALAWVNCGDCDVEEITCCAQGDDTCKFRVYDPKRKS